MCVQRLNFQKSAKGGRGKERVEGMSAKFRSSQLFHELQTTGKKAKTLKEYSKQPEKSSKFLDCKAMPNEVLDCFQIECRIRKKQQQGCNSSFFYIVATIYDTNGWRNIALFQDQISKPFIQVQKFGKRNLKMLGSHILSVQNCSILFPIWNSFYETTLNILNFNNLGERQQNLYFSVFFFFMNYQ